MKSFFHLPLTILTIFIIVCPLTIFGNPYRLYVSPDGNDDGNGSIQDPIKTLQRANDILSAANPETDVEIIIRSNRGDYLAQHVQWTYFDSLHSTTITSDPDTIQARFSGLAYAEPHAFFTLLAEEGCPTNIVIRNLSIEDYTTRAILFRGEREDKNNWNGFNRIESCKFKNIGNYDKPSKHIAYSVIGFINSRNNVVTDCEFVNIKNRTAANFTQLRHEKLHKKSIKKKYPNIVEHESAARMGGGHNPNLPIICIYITHHSDSNTVDRNIMKNIKGDVVRVRDDSNYNLISNNTMTLVGWDAVVTSWYCMPEKQRCTKKTREAPSIGTRIIGNAVRGNWLYGKPVLYKDLINEERMVYIKKGYSPKLQNIIQQFNVTIEGNSLEEYPMD